MFKYWNYILIIALFVTLGSCATGKKELSDEEVAIQEKLASKFGNQEFLIYNEDTLLASKEVLSYYDKNEFAPIWIEENGLSTKGTDLFGMVENSMDYGLLPSMFHFSEIQQMVDSSLLDAEMLLTNAFFLMSTHISEGCIDSSNFSYTWKKDQLSYSLMDELDRIYLENESVETVLTEKQPKNWEYIQLQKGLITFLDSFDIDTNHFSIPAFKEDSAACYEVANEALYKHGFLDSTNRTNDSIFIAQLQQFQVLNGLKDDAIVGKWTGRALEKSNQDRFLQAALSMEKWKWKPDTLPEKYIRVNIPEFNLYFVDSNKVKRKHRVVVGAYTTQTPEFSATMFRMVTNPFWHVPYSIASTEILYGAKKDTGYFRKKGYKVFKNGDPVDPKSVDWSTIRQGNFPYRVRQDGGGGNSLGRLKFLFPNVNSVFIHDTPSKRLFKNDVRAYSHGCVRLDQPFELGKALLTADKHEVVADTLDSMIVRGQQTVLELNDPFTVFIEYYTATGDSSGNIIFHPDIYGRDEKYLENSFKKFLD